jgi:hypothetical protein
MLWTGRRCLPTLKETEGNMNSTGFPNTYAEFCFLITQRCGTKLTRTYCRERIDALGNLSISSTKEFVQAYGPQHQQQIIAWYEKAEREAVN